MLGKVDRRDTQTVIHALIKHAHKLLWELYKSLTWDRGSEVADHRRFTLATDIQVYRTIPGSAAPMRTPMDCLNSTSPRASMYRASHKLSSMPSQES
jgi:hypothetical protein